MSRARGSYLIAGIIAVAIVLWMLSGLIFKSDTAKEPQRAAGSDAGRGVLVQAFASQAQAIERFIVTEADVHPFRSAVIKAETAGRVDDVRVREGQRVEQGTLLAKLSLEAREAALAQATAERDRLEQDLQAAEKLAGQDYTPEQRVRQLAANLAAAKAEVARIEEEIRDTSIEAPFAGVVNNIAVERGEFVAIGGDLTTIIDNDPLKVTGEISQQSIGRVNEGDVATVTFATGRTAKGRVCFISAMANPETRTFAVEMWVANPSHLTPSGVSAEARIPTGQIEAHKISPAILSLNADGELGIKAVEGEAAKFYSIEIVRSGTDGAWVSGLPERLQIISVGQGFVQEGDKVRIAKADAKPEQETPDKPAQLDATTQQALGAPAAAAEPTQPPSCKEEESELHSTAQRGGP
jgi:membrane fusion protein, multidrug efflux system